MAELPSEPEIARRRRSDSQAICPVVLGAPAARGDVIAYLVSPARGLQDDGKQECS